jgi:UMF1 family MFS transporter
MLLSNKSAAFYGFFNFSVKLAGSVEPLLFGIVSSILGVCQIYTGTVIVFFILGGFLLTRVNEKEGIHMGKEDETRFIKVFSKMVTS